jgi:hypothetical protein
MGVEREFGTSGPLDMLRIRFVTADDLDRAGLRDFLAEHIASVQAAGSRQSTGHRPHVENKKAVSIQP